MKKIAIVILAMISIQLLSAQHTAPAFVDKVEYVYPPIWTKDSVTHWCGSTINEVVYKSDYIFEGYILSDSGFYTQYGTPNHYQNILVTKEFKGTYLSDTVSVIILGDIYATKGDEAFFLVSNREHILTDFYGDECGFIPVCNKKDIEKYVYDPIAKAVGQPYKEIHPTMCATQQQKKK